LSNWRVVWWYFDNRLVFSQDMLQSSNIDVNCVLTFFKVFASFSFDDHVRFCELIQMSFGGAWEITIQCLEQFFPLCHHGQIKSPLIVLSQQPWKRKAPSTWKQMNLWVISWLLKPPYDYLKDLVITKVRLFAYPPPTTHYDVRRTNVLFHAYIAYTRIKIHDWLSIVITSFVFQKAKFSLASTLSFFQLLLTYKICHFSTSPIKPMYFGITRTFNNTNIFCIILWLGGGGHD